MKLLSGKEVSQHVYNLLTDRIETLKKKNIIPGLAVVLVGEDPASKVYVRSKAKRFASLNLFSETLVLPETTSEGELLDLIKRLNKDSKYHGILVQLPLPSHINTDHILDEILPEKDVDGFHPVNLGKLAQGRPQFVACTPKGIMRILDYYDIDLSGKSVVIIGRSNIVGRPMSLLTSLKTQGANATTTICHSGTKNIPEITKMADVIIAAIGVPELIDESYIKEGAIVIDVGMNRVDSPERERGYKLVGDVNQKSIENKVAAITPVPGGVGPMTIAMLVENTVEAAERLSKII
ncbi:MAG: bifunctional 5,10-methylenetetrahydrofolate dehydrogenase/5,10-methenyltetrahydrofolate cyclohydrolase [Candidatus Marinimicrobia bacterium]|nr:bifunctional 5,10-methylenetetrahydrofolate dehydrogenase/5,10-methenyltetrahydrofolate cyclohydrolase [Candidatus Neomarinimicrobiota bacterium]